MTVPERLSALRKCMEEKNIDVYVGRSKCKEFFLFLSC